MIMLAPLTWHAVWTTWRVAWWWDLAIATAGLAYLRGLLRVRGSGWPARRTGAFAGGLALSAVTLNSFVDVYAHPLFWIHMVQHLMLIMVIPVFLVAGAPLRLAVTAAGESGRLARLIDSPAGAVSRPLVGAALYTVVIVGTHLTSFMQLMLTHPAVHQGEKALYLVSGLLLFWPLVGAERVRQTVPYLVRLVVLFLVMTVDTFVGVILMLTRAEPFPGYTAMHQSWEPAPITDLHYGGAIMWCGGDAIMFLICLAVALQWILDPGRRDHLGTWLESVRRTALDTPEALDPDGDDDRARLAYNQLLQRLDHDRP